MFRNKLFTVRRRFSDFLGLYQKLSEKHGPNGLIVPPPPEKSILGKGVWLFHLSLHAYFSNPECWVLQE